MGRGMWIGQSSTGGFPPIRGNRSTKRGQDMAGGNGVRWEGFLSQRTQEGRPMTVEEELEELWEQYRNISQQIDALREQKRAVTAMIADKEEVIEAGKRAGWGQIIG